MKVRLKATNKIKILNGADLYAVMQKVLLRESKIDRNKEHFWVISLAQNNALLNIELISLGSVKTTVVEPMEVFSVALQKRSVQIILVHNHPNGELQPSAADRDITDHLIQVGHFLQVPVLDHLMITETAYYSFVDSGLLAELARSKRHVLPYKEQERLLAEARAIGNEEGEARREKEMARALKASGVDPKIIAEATGLSLTEVKKLKG